MESIANNKRKSFGLNKFKVNLAKLISKEVSEELEKSIIVEGVHRGGLTPKSKKYNKLVKKIKPLADKIEKISKDFYVVEKTKNEEKR